MRAILLLTMAAVTLVAADSDWAKVKTLHTGTELRVYQKGTAAPLQAQMADLTDENLVVLVKKTQTAIPKDQIERVDARPDGRRVTKETTTKEVPPDLKDAGPSPQRGSGTGVPGGSSTSTNVVIGGKGEFETVYRRPTGAPKK